MLFNSTNIIRQYKWLRLMTDSRGKPCIAPDGAIRTRSVWLKALKKQDPESMLLADGALATGDPTPKI